jgi:hypothetical protein
MVFRTHEWVILVIPSSRRAYCIQFLLKIVNDEILLRRKRIISEKTGSRSMFQAVSTYLQLSVMLRPHNKKPPVNSGG